MSETPGPVECVECGALVAPARSGDHTEWHTAVNDMAQALREDGLAW